MKDKNINWPTLPNLASLGWTVKLHEDIRYLTIASVLSCTNCKSLLSNWPLRILGFSYAENPMLTFNSFLGKAMELSFPKRKCNKMIVPKNRKINDETVPFLVIQVLFCLFSFKN